MYTAHQMELSTNLSSSSTNPSAPSSSVPSSSVLGRWDEREDSQEPSQEGDIEVVFPIGQATIT